MNRNIVRENSSEIRAITRNVLKDNWFKVVMGMFVFYVMTITIPTLIAALIPSATMNYYNQAIGQSYGFSYVGSLYTTVLSGAFELGMCSFILAFIRKKDINAGYIFNGFEYFLKAFALLFMQGLFIFLWSLLFVIPGIIAAFRYSQSFYILADHPEKGVMQCINESKMLMMGNKGNFFGLLLSFMGWMILAMLLTTFLMPATVEGVVETVFDLFLSIPYIIVLAYMATARGIFYDLVSGNLVAKKTVVEEDYQFTPRYIEENKHNDEK